MPLKINNKEITNLFINGTEYNALCINNDGKFGKKFSLIQNVCTGATVSVNRGTSPYQKAVTGYLSGGSAIYFGDSLTLAVNCISDYRNAELYIDIGDGNGMVKRASPFTFSVIGNVKYYGVAQKVQVNYETLFSGSKVFTSSGSLNVSGLNVNDVVDITADITFVEYIEERTPDYSYRNLKQSKLPASAVSDNASVLFSAGNGKINIEFNSYAYDFKGLYAIQFPSNVEIKEIRRQL